MKALKRFFAIVGIMALSASLLPQTTYAQRGEKAAGLQLGYVSKNESMSANLFFQYGFTNHFRVAPQIGCVFRHHNLDAFTIDVDAHMPITLGTDKVRLYPLAGIDYSSWSWHGKVPVVVGPGDVAEEDQQIIKDKDVSSRTSRFGINAGAGVELVLTSTLKINMEAKYTITKKYSTSKVSVGIAYRF